MKPTINFNFIISWLIVAVIIVAAIIIRVRSNLALFLIWLNISLVLFRPSRLITRKTMHSLVAFIALCVISAGLPNITALILGIIGVLLTLGIACVIPKKAFIAVAVISTITLLVSIYAFLFYFPFRLQIKMDLSISGVSTHTAGGYLPLPPKTVFVSRFSSTGAQYITNTKEEGIIKYYNIISEDGSFESREKGEETILSFSYRQTHFNVTIIKTTHWRRGEFIVEVG